MKSADTAVPFLAGAAGRSADEMEFLPAALEIAERPPAKLGYTLSYITIGIFCATLGWAIFGTTDIIAVAHGKVVPADRSKVIQPFETGVIRLINVTDGQNVKAGAVLVELDPTMTEADLGHLKSDLVATRLDAARLRAALDADGDQISNLRTPDGADEKAMILQQGFLAAQRAEQKAKLDELERQQAQKEAERGTIEASINKLNETSPLLEEKVKVRKYLQERALGSKLQYLSDLQELVGQQQDIKVLQSRGRELDEAIASLTKTRQRVAAQYRHGLFEELVKAEEKAAGLEQDVIKAEKRTALQRLTAPIDGVVQQLAVHTLGGVVTPAQALMVVVPVDGHLEIEAMIPNRDIGFVEAGQEVAVKIDTFNFTRYGLLRGKVISVSHDSITHNVQSDKAANEADGRDSEHSEPAGQELVYAARVSVERTKMQIDDRYVNLEPGMAVTAEIKTGSRRIISYVLSPLLEYGHDSLRER